MSVIRIYVEGGGDKDGKARMRQAFSQFLSESRDAARERRARWLIIPSGSREETYRNFRRGVADHPEARVFLLVDADRPVPGTPREHLAGGETRWNLTSVEDDQCHLMAQVMESWFLADPDAMARFYGPGFGAKQIPARQNVEEVPKAEVEAALKNATAKTKKGEYHKIQHGAPILESLNPDLVRSRAPHCDRLFKALQEAIG